jgi:hypothetical protein
VTGAGVGYATILGIVGLLIYVTVTVTPFLALIFLLLIATSKRRGGGGNANVKTAESSLVKSQAIHTLSVTKSGFDKEYIHKIKTLIIDEAKDILQSLEKYEKDEQSAEYNKLMKKTDEEAKNLFNKDSHLAKLLQGLNFNNIKDIIKKPKYAWANIKTAEHKLETAKLQNKFGPQHLQNIGDYNHSKTRKARQEWLNSIRKDNFKSQRAKLSELSYSELHRYSGNKSNEKLFPTAKNKESIIDNIINKWRDEK